MAACVADRLVDGLEGRPCGKEGDGVRGGAPGRFGLGRWGHRGLLAALDAAVILSVTQSVVIEWMTCYNGGR
ncbi:hypothetical protein GCM10010231_14040 [Streptomyces sindenensis]|nr:hypothetical protein GCM10010231_14040 [Streptomyces sindenensis]